MPAMRHFGFLSHTERGRLFVQPPEHFTLSDEPELLGAALGGTLYCPATRTQLAGDIRRRAADGLVSVVVCLEDAVPDALLGDAERNAIEQLRLLEGEDDLPMIFVRVRNADQIPMLLDGLGTAASVLAGFVVPKFTEDTGSVYLHEIVRACDRLGRACYVMPVLEAAEVIYAETRLDALLGIRRVLDKYRDLVP